MGIENRAYMQDEFRRSPFGGGRRDMVTTLIMINVAVIVLQLVFTHQAGGERASFLNDWFALDVNKVLGGQIWRIFTYDFLHSTEGYGHIFWNMFLLYMAGKKVEDSYGSREFLWFYLCSGWLAGVFFVVWDKAISSQLPDYVAGSAVGASGAVVAVMILYVLNWPHDRWLIFFFLPVPVWLLALLDVCADVFPLLQELGGRDSRDGIAHAAHFGGMLFAYLYWRYSWRAADWFQRFRWKDVRKALRRKPKLRVHDPDAVPRERKVAAPIPEDVSARVDALLEKIAQSGESSLTAAEREYLTEASRRYRQRS